jgi:hypothetical protein
MMIKLKIYWPKHDETKDILAQTWPKHDDKTKDTGPNMMIKLKILAQT